MTRVLRESNAWLAFTVVALKQTFGSLCAFQNEGLLLGDHVGNIRFFANTRVVLGHLEYSFGYPKS